MNWITAYNELREKPEKIKDEIEEVNNLVDLIKQGIKPMKS